MVAIVASLRSYKASYKSASRVRYAGGHANLESPRSCPRHERERERETERETAAAILFTIASKPIRNTKNPCNAGRENEVSLSGGLQRRQWNSAGEFCRRAWEWFFMLLGLRASDEWKLRNKERRQLPIIFLSSLPRRKVTQRILLVGVSEIDQTG